MGKRKAKRKVVSKKKQPFVVKLDASSVLAEGYCDNILNKNIEILKQYHLIRGELLS